ncbi:DUF1810 domain-containing protein [Pedobacter sp. Leaf170]|uniref:DUF1810 domain-containing protein n=1 Tax=Pedobacter sp. Leaf170 TaxID=2876558 RepID=UPI001E37659F|nr:DUF1810 domain-containing protein [Pedobacter sp. Leaf170]
MNSEGLSRYLVAQNETYMRAVDELKNGRKESHWMWYIFPQLKGLGKSETAQFYGLNDLAEAQAFLQHPVLGENLLEITKITLNIKDKSALDIFGNPDNLKLRSCMSLFAQLEEANPLFQQVLDKYFNGEADQQTLSILQNQA